MSRNFMYVDRIGRQPRTRVMCLFEMMEKVVTCVPCKGQNKSPRDSNIHTIKKRCKILLVSLLQNAHNLKKYIFNIFLGNGLLDKLYVLFYSIFR